MRTLIFLDPPDELPNGVYVSLLPHVRQEAVLPQAGVPSVAQFLQRLDELVVNLLFLRHAPTLVRLHPPP